MFCSLERYYIWYYVIGSSLVLDLFFSSTWGYATWSSLVIDAMPLDLLLYFLNFSHMRMGLGGVGWGCYCTCLFLHHLIFSCSWCYATCLRQLTKSRPAEKAALKIWKSLFFPQVFRVFTQTRGPLSEPQNHENQWWKNSILSGSAYSYPILKSAKTLARFQIRRDVYAHSYTLLQRLCST